MAFLLLVRGFFRKESAGIPKDKSSVWLFRKSAFLCPKKSEVSQITEQLNRYPESAERHTHTAKAAISRLGSPKIFKEIV